MQSLAFFLQDTAANQSMIQHMAMLILAVIPLIIVVVLVLIIVPCWFICKKAGLSPWLSLLCLIPSLGLLVLLYVVAFSDWRVVPVPEAQWAPQHPTMPPQA